MKKFYILLLCLLSTFAAVSAQNVLATPQAFNPAHLTKMSQLNTSQLFSNARQVPLKAPGVITEQPAGKLCDNLIVSSNAFLNNWLYGIIDASTDAGVGKIVEGNDGNIYIYNLPTTLNAGSWVKAERAEGDTVVIKKQLIDQRQGSEALYNYYITKVVWQWSNKETGEGKFVEAEGDTDIKLIYRDGILKSIAENTDPIFGEGYAIGAVYTTDNKTFTWEGCTNWNIEIAPLTDKVTTLPENATVETITVSYNPESPLADQVNCAFVGDEIYINLFAVGAYIKGQIQGDKVVFKSRQYLGTYSGVYHIFFVGEHFTEVTDEASGQVVQVPEIIDELVFDYNAADRSFKTKDALALNAGKSTTRLNLNTLKEPHFYFFKEVPAIPADPQITNYNATYDAYGYNALQFNIIATDREGNFIVPERVSWKAYIDDEPFIFTPDDYRGLTADMEEIPYGWYDSNYDIYTSFYTFFFEPAKNVGIQTIYRGGGEEHRSNIVYYDINTAQTYTVSDTDGIALRKDSQNEKVVSTVYYDMTGRKVAADAKGLIIKKVTLSDGSQKSYKLVRK